MLTGRCHCGAIRYRVEGEPVHHALCHCGDCRRHAGAPMVGWALFPNDRFAVTEGEAKVYESSEHGRRHFCADCGSGLFFSNEMIFPGATDIQSATLDDPGALPPQAQIQMAERIAWVDELAALPKFDRFPGG